MFVFPSPQSAHDHTRRGFAVVDLETNGFDADLHRIVEIAIVRTDCHGNELGVFETLVNPGSEDVGPTTVHGIRAEMLADAPTFPEIAEAVLAWLDGVVVVAHHAQFEDAFLSAEFRRAGWPSLELPALDTLAIAQSQLHLANNKLATVCAWAGVDIHNAHTAGGDARATAALLPRLLEATRYSPRWALPPTRLQPRLRGRYQPRGLSIAQ